MAKNEVIKSKQSISANAKIWGTHLQDGFQPNSVNEKSIIDL
jgi:hypothetical protein